MLQNMSEDDELLFLNDKIKKAEEAGEKPLKQDILRIIELLNNALVYYLETMSKQGVELTDTGVVEVEVRQYSAMKFFAQKLNLPVSEYDEKIKQAQIRIFGEENWENFFGN